MDKKLALTILFNGADKLSGNLKKIVGLGRSGAQEMGKLKREAKGLDRELRDVRKSILRGDEGFDGPLLDRARRLRQEIARTNRELEKRAKFLKIDNQVARMHARGDELMTSGRNNVIAGSAMLAPFILAGKGAMDFSSGMVDLQQKAELSNAELVKMRGNILSAARASHQLPEDMRAAVDVLAGFGMDPREAVRLAGTIGRLGTAFKVELADGSAAAYANINNLKIAATQTGRAFDIMAAGGNAGAFEIKDMARWFPQLTAQAQSLGQHGLGAVADLTAALQIARRGTGSADQAANNVANLLAKINAPGTIKAFEKNFGVDLPAALQAAYRKGKTPLEAIAEITQKATKGDLTKLGFAFEDMQAQGALRMLVQNMGDYQQMRAEISNAGGTVDAAFSQRELNDASVKWMAFRSQLSATAITVGTKLLPVGTELLGIVGGLLTRVANFAEANPRLTSALLYLAVGAGAARVGLGALQFAFGGILKPAASAWGMFAKWRAAGSIAAAFPKAAKAFMLLRTAALFLAKGVMRAGLLMLANPMVLAITAIVLALGAAGYLIYKHWDTIKDGFNTGVAFLTDLGGRMLGYGKAIVQGLVNGITSAPGAVWNALKSIVLGGINRIKTFLGIKSPSRLFMGIGGYMTDGLAIGLDKGARRPLASMTRLSAGVAGAMALSASPAAATGPLGGVAQQVAADVARSVTLAPQRGSSGAQERGSLHIGKIEVHQQPGEDGDALARRVIAEIERRWAVQRRGAYLDD